MYGLPSVLILLYALHEIKSDHIRFYGFLLLEVFAVHVVIFWMPLMAVKFLLSFPTRPGDDDHQTLVIAVRLHTTQVQTVYA